MKLQLLLAAAVAVAPPVFAKSSEVPSLRGTIIDDAEDGDVAAVSSTFFSDRVVISYKSHSVL